MCEEERKKNDLEVFGFELRKKWKKLGKHHFLSLS